MKKSFKLVSSLCVGLLAVSAGVALATNNVEAKQTDAAVTAGQKRFNVLIDSENWRLDNVITQVQWNGDGFHKMGTDADLPISDLSSYNKVKLGGTGTEYYFETIEVTDYTGFTYDNYQFGRGSETDPWNKFWGGSPKSISTDNTVKITGTWDHFVATSWGTYYKVNRHTGVDNTQTSVVLENAYNFAPADAPEITGYTFDGWFTDSTFQTPYVTQTITGDLNLYAKYTALTKSYAINYDGNGADSGEMSPSAANPESEFVIPSSEFVREGCKQVGWAVSPVGDVVFTDTIPANTYSDGDEVTLYAVWNEVGYKDYFFTNNKGFESVYVHYWGSSISESTWPGQECDFAYINENDENVYKTTVPEDVTGLIFNNNGQGLQTDDIIGDKLEHTAFYCSSDSSPYEVGTWDVAYTHVTYNFNGGSGDPISAFDAYKNAKGIKVNDGSGLTKEGGLIFGHWNTKSDDSGDSSYIGDDLNTYINTVGAGDTITLYAQYRLNIEDGYYLLGDMNDWAPNADSKMILKETGEDPVVKEYYLEQEFDLGDEFQVVKFERGEATYYGWNVLEYGEGSARNAAQIVDAEKLNNMKVAYAGTYTPYFKLSSSTIWISAIEETHVYQIKVNDTTYDLVANPGNPDEYMTASDVSLTSGDILAYYKDEALQTANPKAIGNNNCYSNEGVTTVCLNIESKIYVDIKANTIFCAGLDVNKFYMSVNNNPVDLKHNESPADPTFDEYYTTGYTFAYNDVIKFVDTKESNANAVVFKVLTVNESSTEGFEVVDEELLCTASEGKQTDVYVKFKSGADEVYFGDVAEDLAAAIKYAKAFNSALSSVCVAQGQTVVADLQAAWSAQASEFTSLIKSARTILKNADGSHSNLDIKEFAQKYDYVYSHYSTQLASHGGNFIDRTPVEASPFVYGLTANNNTLITIVVICSVSSVTLLGVILLIKRRRNLVK